MLESIISFSSLYWISYFLWICSHSRKSTENVCKQWDITKTYNWI